MESERGEGSADSGGAAEELCQRGAERACGWIRRWREFGGVEDLVLDGLVEAVHGFIVGAGGIRQAARGGHGDCGERDCARENGLVNKQVDSEAAGGAADDEHAVVVAGGLGCDGGKAADHAETGSQVDGLAQGRELGCEFEEAAVGVAELCGTNGESGESPRTAERANQRVGGICGDGFAGQSLLLTSAGVAAVGQEARDGHSCSGAGAADAGEEGDLCEVERLCAAGRTGGGRDLGVA